MLVVFVRIFLERPALMFQIKKLLFYATCYINVKSSEHDKLLLQISQLEKSEAKIPWPSSVMMV